VTLSVIIVNYNVKYFLEQCLCSVKKATAEIDAEVMVIDNNSVDGSLDYLQPKFPWVNFISNDSNDGFAKANNKGLMQAKGKYILFLNPDTIVAEDSFEKCISFIESHSNTGALGVKMIDGRGVYLKESKRGFPSPWVSFCKLSGLAELFPHSTLFAKYYLGYLSENENQIIDAVAGAFLFVKREALNKTGSFDEQFFMYAEDIDLSHRIQQSGYTNYYLAETSIIHFKGESTKKDFRYVKLFYKAMSLFARKYFNRDTSSFLLIIIELAIWLRAALSLIGNLFKRKNAGKNDQAKYFLTGDASAVNGLKKIFVPGKGTISDKERDADEIIFCQGDDFSFGQIITAIQQPRSLVNYKVYSSGSFSVVGSVSRNKSGETIAL
jgi:N-acetylglucosaminyl-diphospho-decaprenol L-rhamnosyltransferase